MHLTLLGELAVDGRPIPGTRVGTLVRALAAAEGRVVTVTRLADTLWDGEEPVPADPAAAVQALVARARRLGLPILTAAGGYRIDTKQLTTDVSAAQQHLTQARTLAATPGEAAAAVETATAGLDLLPPEASDPEDEPVVRRLRSALLEVGVTAALADGRTVDTARLEAAAFVTPPDEPLVALLVTVLAAQGRHAQAMAVVERLRTELAETYGTDPSQVVQRAHLALLTSTTPAGEAAGGGGTGRLGSGVVGTGVVGAGVVGAGVGGTGRLGSGVDAPGGTASPDPAVEPTRAAGSAPLAPARVQRRIARRTTVVGRAEEIGTVVALVTAHPLVSIIAPGGAGKTTLAAEVLDALDLPVMAVQLADLRSPDDVVPAVIAAMAGHDRVARSDPRIGSAPATHADHLAALASTASGVLVLDNCEHLLAAVADVVSAVMESASPQLRILSTSRAPLAVVGEVIHRLPPLSDTAAVSLLRSRATAARADLVWDDELASQICERLDRLPLGIELAAARLRTIPLLALRDALLAHVVLDPVLRGLPDRHASLWHVVDWSWQLLEESERHLLRCLSLAPAPVTLPCATALAGGNDPSATTAALDALVDHSLLQLVDAPDGGVARYRMLETVREYASSQLEADGSRDEVMRRLARWSRHLANRLSMQVFGSAQLETLATVDLEAPTLLVAYRWATVHQPPTAWAIASLLTQVLTVRGLHVDAVGLARPLIESWVAEHENGTGASSAATAGMPAHRATVALLTQLNCAALLGDGVALGAKAAVVLHEAAATSHGRLPERLAALVTASALIDPAQGLTMDVANALEIIASSFGPTSDPWLQALSHLVRALLLDNLGEPVTSAAWAIRAYQQFRIAQDSWGMGLTAIVLGRVRGVDGHDPVRWLAEGSVLLGAIGAAEDARRARTILDLAYAIDGDTDAAERLALVAADPQIRVEDRSQAVSALAAIAVVERRWEDAARLATATADLARQAPIPFPQIVATAIALKTLVLCKADAAAGRSGGTWHAEAFVELSDACTLILPSCDQPVIGTVMLAMGALAMATGGDPLSIELCAMARRLSINITSEYGELVAAAIDPRPDDPQVTTRAAQLRELTPEAAVQHAERLADRLGGGAEPLLISDAAAVGPHRQGSQDGDEAS